MTGPQAPEVRCPGRSTLDWASDGFAIAANGPRIELERFAPSRRGFQPWQCRRCGYQLVEGDRLASALTQLQQAHWE